MSRLTLMQRILGRVASAVPANGALRLTHAPICSFTFDDGQLSSLTAAGRMLEEAGAAGTYYISGKMMRDPLLQETVMKPADLRALLARGHEIGCHTYGHHSAARLSAAELSEDLTRNEQAIIADSGVHSLTSISYPFGEVSFAAKRLCASRFAAARGTRPGLNYRFIDLAELRANKIESSNYSLENCQKLIDTAKRESAWLIFYSHDVRTGHSPWGCTEEQFAGVLNAVVKSEIEIMTVRAAVGRMMFRRAA